MRSNFETSNNVRVIALLEGLETAFDLGPGNETLCNQLTDFIRKVKIDDYFCGFSGRVAFGDRNGTIVYIQWWDGEEECEDALSSHDSF